MVDAGARCRTRQRCREAEANAMGWRMAREGGKRRQSKKRHSKYGVDAVQRVSLGDAAAGMRSKTARRTTSSSDRVTSEKKYPCALYVCVRVGRLTVSTNSKTLPAISCLEIGWGWAFIRLCGNRSVNHPGTAAPLTY
ncbi:hypothetical protein IF1G_07150 [Cordyceps javanica]|uniref:Uncharacterized protein n=1 Tax=Cordyceps javanica TaxID=43265 RepID=A0A545UXS9_9HYPO|nr:hypothetical protein IF1G_07150 [Cordyceps javanica]